MAFVFIGSVLWCFRMTSIFYILAFVLLVWLSFKSGRLVTSAYSALYGLLQPRNTYTQSVTTYVLLQRIAEKNIVHTLPTSKIIM